MHENNPFQNIKDYWTSYYSSITEGAVKDTLNDMGYYFTDEGKHAGKWVHEKTGKALSTNHAMEIAAERANRKKKSKNKETDAAGPNPTDKDARKQGEESTHSEEVEYDGEQLDEKNINYQKNLRRAVSLARRAGVDVGTQRRITLDPHHPRHDEGRGRDIDPIRVGMLRNASEPTKIPRRVGIGTDGGSVSKAVDRVRNLQMQGAKKRIMKKSSAVRTSENQQEGLFHKDSDRLLREHIRAEYEARGIYPTSREVQETFNHVVDLLEKTSASKRDEILAQQHGTSGTETGLKLTKQELRRRRAGNSPQDYGDPKRTSREEGERQAAHAAKRGKKTKISPSSPARKQSEVEQDTRFLMGQGFSPSHLRRIMSDTGR